MTEYTLPVTPRAWHRRIWRLTWPVILANITIPLVGVADVAVMGRLPDPAYIGAVTLGAALFSAVYWLFGFLRMGTTGLAAQAFGGGEVGEIAAIFIRGASVALALGLIIVAVQVPLSILLFTLFDPSAEVAALAADYYEIRVYGAPGLLLYLVVLGVLFGLQRMRDTLWLSVGLNVTNLVLDVVLVLGFDMGVKGVAVGTLISEWGAAIAGMLFVRRALHAIGWRPPWPANIWQPQALRALFHVSGNLVLRTFFVQLPFFVGTVAATRLGDLTLAVHGVLMQLFFVMTYALDGFAHTAETLAGYAYGARQADALRSTTRYCAVWATLLAVLTGVTYISAGELFIGLLTTSEEIRASAAGYLAWVASAPLLCVWAFLFDGIFIGTTRIVEMRNAMFLAALIWIAALWVSYAPFAYHGVWLAMSIFMLSRSILLAFYYPRIERAAREL